MQKKFWKTCFISALALSALAQPLLMADPLTYNTTPMTGQAITEADLMRQMNPQDKTTYQSLNPAGRALVLKMANMNGNATVMMQNCMNKMDSMMAKMDTMMAKMNNMQNPNSLNMP